MNRLRQLCLTVALTLTLSLSAFAGEIECGLTEPPPPTAASVAVDALLTLLGVVASLP